MPRSMKWNVGDVPHHQHHSVARANAEPAEVGRRAGHVVGVVGVGPLDVRAVGLLLPQAHLVGVGADGVEEAAGDRLPLGRPIELVARDLTHGDPLYAVGRRLTFKPSPAGRCARAHRCRRGRDRWRCRRRAPRPGSGRWAAPRRDPGSRWCPATGEHLERGSRDVVGEARRLGRAPRRSTPPRLRFGGDLGGAAVLDGVVDDEPQRPGEQHGIGGEAWPRSGARTSTCSGSVADSRTSSRIVCTTTRTGSGVSTPASSRLRISSSSMSRDSRDAARCDRSSMWWRCSAPRVSSWASSVSRKPLMIVIGVRSSWLTRAMKSDLSRSSSMTSWNRRARSSDPAIWLPAMSSRARSPSVKVRSGPGADREVPERRARCRPRGISTASGVTVGVVVRVRADEPQVVALADPQRGLATEHGRVRAPGARDAGWS